MPVYNTSSAHKLEVLEQAAQKKKAALKLVRGRKNKGVLRGILTMRSVSTFLLVIAVMGLIVYNQTCLNEVTGKINRMNSNISEKESENVRLASTLETTTSLHSLTEQAQRELGLQKLDKYQIEYVSLYKDTRIELTPEAPKESLGSSLSLTVNSALRQIKEYIGIA